VLKFELSSVANLRRRFPGELPTFEDQWRGGSFWSSFSPFPREEPHRALPDCAPSDADKNERNMLPHFSPDSGPSDRAFRMGQLFRNVMDTFSSLFGR
jgi:hypothetical protein